MMRWCARLSFRTVLIVGFLLILSGVGCGGDATEESRSGRPSGGGRPERGQGGSRGGERGGGRAAAVPVETARVERRSISSFIETNGTLEAENEVDIVARLSAPIVELLVEEGDAVRKGQRLARLEDEALRARLSIDRVAMEEAELAFRRAQQLSREDLISGEDYEQASARYESAKAQLEASEVEMSYVDIRAPFGGLIVTRYVDFAEQVSANSPLFRISDFDPLLCPIQVPERDLARLSIGQPAYLTVESWADERFSARVLRISPVIDSTTGTVKVTLEVESRGKLRPGMFARVFLRTATRDDVLVVPRAALSLESIGDTVYLAVDGVASRREVELGFREGEFVEIVSGVQEGDAVVVVGQDGLSEGTPVQDLAAAPRTAPNANGGDRPGPEAGNGEGRRGGAGRGDRPPLDPSSTTPEQQEQIKTRMRERGMTDEQIEQRLETMRKRAASRD